MSTNADSIANQAGDGSSGEFSSRIAPSEPMMSSGKQPGKLVGNDAAPEFQAETLPAGTAPTSRTFQPNPTDEAPPQATNAAAEDTILGSTSGDVHTGLGHPGSGQSSTEIRHDGEKGRNNPGKSVQGVGESTQNFETNDERDPQYKDDVDERERGRGEKLGAEDREPVSAENLASERSGRERQDRGN
ncbi:hypothetical protein BDY17DRAFT_254649 [Neohortaea acidophila]|uniref:Uncharacterized protein n=1 Tax=Neohortaea acidophila TaxID=245834 RepID=A0A6A6PMQ5_9PEZI|nr:uncharacterized protein BDY17DRAFT_254649 [Neohortaea acidophila]KAF2480924.1 hypothetical protein BDY17DRAFT_254649 [Neohortaea acidophila]